MVMQTRGLGSSGHGHKHGLGRVLALDTPPARHRQPGACTGSLLSSTSALSEGEGVRSGVV
jgi:hypothetical protein